jgi:hypothetical protein
MPNSPLHGRHLYPTVCISNGTHCRSDEVSESLSFWTFLSSSVLHNYKTQNFGYCICFHLQMKGGTNVPGSPILVILMKEALSSSETSVFTRATRRTFQMTPFLKILFVSLSLSLTWRWKQIHKECRFLVCGVM